MNIKKQHYILLIIYYILLISIVLVNPNIKIFTILIFAVVFYINNKNFENAIEFTILLIISTPLSMLEQYFCFGNQGTASAFNFPFVFLSLLFLLIFLKTCIKKYGHRKRKWSMGDLLIWISFLCISLNVIISNAPLNDKINEYKYYIFILLCYLITRKYVLEKGIKSFFNIMRYGIFYSSLVILIIYILGNPSDLGLLDWENRYSFGFESIYILTIPSHIYMISINNQKTKNIFQYLALIIESYLVVICQNRTVIIILAVNIIITLSFIFVKAIKNKNKNYGMKNVIFVFSFCILISAIVNIGIKLEWGIFERLSEITNKNSVGNLQTREITNQYAYELFKHKPEGYGIGSRMSMISPNGIVYSNPLFVDNAIISIIYKFGNTSIMIFFIIGIIVMGNLFRKISISSIILVSILLELLVVCGFMTSQLLHNNAVVIIFIGLLCHVFNNYRSVI